MYDVEDQKESKEFGLEHFLYSQPLNFSTCELLTLRLCEAWYAAYPLWSVSEERGIN